jgi:phospholipase/carboxylesterase
MTALLETVEVNPKEKAQACVIWMHGLGADGHDFESIVPELQLDVPMRFVFPHAPIRPVTINMGMQMRAWFDIKALDREVGVDYQDISQSALQIKALIQREHLQGFPFNRIFLAGFSQGGAVALRAGLCYQETLAGILVLSSLFPHTDLLKQDSHKANAGISIFQAHGSYDPVLPIQMGHHLKDYLVEEGYPVAWESYPMPHSVCMEEIQAISAWLNARFKEWD